MKIKTKVFLPLLFMLTALLAVFMAKDWRIEVSRYPLVVGIFLFVLCLADVIRTLFSSENNGENQLPSDIPSAMVLEPNLVRRRTLEIFGWMMAFFIMIALLGFHISIPLFVFLYLILVGRYRWYSCLIYAAAAWGFFYGLFDKLLYIPLPHGMIVTWSGITL